MRHLSESHIRQRMTQTNQNLVVLALRHTEPPTGDSGLQPDSQIPRRVYTGAGFEANAFLVIGCGTFLLAAWLVFKAFTDGFGPQSLSSYLLLGAAASVIGGLFLVFQYLKRLDLSVEVNSHAIVLRDGKDVTDTVLVADLVNFFAMASRDLLNRPSDTRPRSCFLITPSHQVRLPIEIAGQEQMCEHISDLLSAIHLGRLRNAVGQGSYQIAEGVVITPAGVRDARNPADGLAWGEVDFDTGGDPSDDEKLRIWKRGALLTSWREIPAQEITLFPVVVALIHELCNKDVGKAPGSTGV